MGGQIVTFFIGQCGNQVGQACWELYCLEHCISPSGHFFDDSVPTDNSFYNFFLETNQGQYVPRTVLVDLEPTVLDEIKLGPYRNLFNSENVINGCEDAANNFARGFYSCDKAVVRQVVRSTRKVVESCDDVQAFMVHHSFGGGTGSGFMSMLLEYLSVEYAKSTKVEFGVFPSPTLSMSVVEPYNTILALHTPMENADVAAFFENESLFRICDHNLAIGLPRFTHLNRMAAQVISGMTASLRFEGPVNTNLIDFQTNLVPYPRIHFPLVSFSPFMTSSKLSHELCSTKTITIAANLRENQMADVDPFTGAYMSCCLLYRGDVNVREANNVISYMKTNQNMKWVDWCPTGYKVGINYQPMIAIPESGMGFSSRSLTLLANSTSIKTVIGRLNHKFRLMYDKKSFIHWYVGEGMEEDEFKDAFDDVAMLEKDFQVLEQTANRSDESAQPSGNGNSGVSPRFASKSTGQFTSPKTTETITGNVPESETETGPEPAEGSGSENESEDESDNETGDESDEESDEETDEESETETQESSNVYRKQTNIKLSYNKPNTIMKNTNGKTLSAYHVTKTSQSAKVIAPETFNDLRHFQRQLYSNLKASSTRYSDQINVESNTLNFDNTTNISKSLLASSNKTILNAADGDCKTDNITINCIPKRPSRSINILSSLKVPEPPNIAVVNMTKTDSEFNNRETSSSECKLNLTSKTPLELSNNEFNVPTYLSKNYNLSKSTNHLNAKPLKYVSTSSIIASTKMHSRHFSKPQFNSTNYIGSTKVTTPANFTTKTTSYQLNLLPTLKTVGPSNLTFSKQQQQQPGNTSSYTSDAIKYLNTSNTNKTTTCKLNLNDAINRRLSRLRSENNLNNQQNFQNNTSNNKITRYIEATSHCIVDVDFICNS